MAAATAGRSLRSRHAAGSAVTSTASTTTSPVFRVSPATQAHSAAVIQ